MIVVVKIIILICIFSIIKTQTIREALKSFFFSLPFTGLLLLNNISALIIQKLKSLYSNY